MAGGWPASTGGQADPTLVFTNHIGMPLLATDGAGAPVWEAKAEPYGQLRGTVNKTHDPGLRYPGQWQDELDLEASCTGDNCTFPGPLEQSFTLFENGYRWYRPDWGRYTQSDPVGIFFPLLKQEPKKRRRTPIGGQGVYVYGAANPNLFKDPLGLCEECDECPSGRWNYFAKRSFSIMIGVGVAVSYGTFKCDGKPFVELPVRVVCSVAGPILAGGVGAEGSIGFRPPRGCSRGDLIGQTMGVYVAVAVFSGTSSWRDGQSGDYSIGVGVAKSIGAGAGYAQCRTIRR